MTTDTQPKHIRANYLRNFVFGAEDSLVSTVGMLSGMAVAAVPTGTIFLAGTILILVSAFSMAAGSILSDNSAREYLTGQDVALGRSAKAGSVMFISYALVGSIPLLPYAWLEAWPALTWSIGLSLIALAVTGFISARLAGSNWGRQISEMVILGGLAIILGVVVGYLLADIPGL